MRPTALRWQSGERHGAESSDSVPPVVRRLLESTSDPGQDQAWSDFLATYSQLLLCAAARLSPEYDAVLDRYAYILDELKRDSCRRLRRFAADGRGRFSTWLVVVAGRLCLDHYRRRYGRTRGRTVPEKREHLSRRVPRRRLMDLAGMPHDLSSVPDGSTLNPEDVLDDQHRREVLRREVSRLAPADQLLLRLRYEQDLTAREIAQLLGLPSPFHVYRRLQAVCKSLRTDINDETSSSKPIPDRTHAIGRRLSV